MAAPVGIVVLKSCLHTVLKRQRKRGQSYDDLDDMGANLRGLVCSPDCLPRKKQPKSILKPIQPQ